MFFSVASNPPKQANYFTGVLLLSRLDVGGSLLLSITLSALLLQPISLIPFLCFFPLESRKSKRCDVDMKFLLNQFDLYVQQGQAVGHFLIGKLKSYVFMDG